MKPYVITITQTRSIHLLVDAESDRQAIALVTNELLDNYDAIENEQWNIDGTTVHCEPESPIVTPNNKHNPIHVEEYC